MAILGPVGHIPYGDGSRVTGSRCHMGHGSSRVTACRMRTSSDTWLRKLIATQQATIFAMILFLLVANGPNKKRRPGNEKRLSTSGVWVDHSTQTYRNADGSEWRPFGS